MKKLLIVVDMQKDFVDGALGSKEAVATPPRILENAAAVKLATSSAELYETVPLYDLTCVSVPSGQARILIFE